MSQQQNKYILKSVDEGKTVDDMYIYQQPKKQISNDAINYLENLDSTPMRAWSPRDYDLLPTLDVENARKSYSEMYDSLMKIYGSAPTGKAIRGDYRFAADVALSTGLGIPYSKVARNHKYYVRAIMGTDMEDDGVIKAFGDNYMTYWYNRDLAWKQLHFDWTNDEDTKIQLLKDMEEIEHKIIKHSDYKDRNIIARGFVASAPIMNQITESLLLTYGGAAIGGAIAGMANGTLAGAESVGVIANVLKEQQGFLSAIKATSGVARGAVIGRDIGIVANIANTYTVETGSLSRELYNIVDENGNRISDTSRKVWSALGGAVNTIIEFASRDPVAGFAKLGKFPTKEAEKSVKKWIIGYGINRFKDANSEALEEMFQTMVGDLVVDWAKMWANEHQERDFDIEDLSHRLLNYMQDGWESYKGTFMPVMVASFIPGTVKDLHTLPKALRQGIDTRYETLNSKENLKEYKKYQKENIEPHVIGMNTITQEISKVKGDYSGEKLGKIDVIQDPDNNSKFVGATEKDRDKLHWLYNRGVKAVDVSILGQASPSINRESLQNLGNAFGGRLDSSSNILTIDNETNLESFKTHLADLGFEISEEGDSFTFSDADSDEQFTVRLATEQTFNAVQNEAKVDQTVKKSDGMIKNRDFAKEIRNALTADGQIETKVTDGEIDAITNLMGMFGNDVTDHISFLSAYDESLTSAETEAIDSARGITSFASDASQSARIILSDSSDATTVVHEMFHVALKYNQNARDELVRSVRKQTKTADGSKELKEFLNEHLTEMKAAGIESADEAMNTLKSISLQNAGTDAKMQEVLTAMWEMYVDSESKTKGKMPAEIKSLFQKIADAFKKIYRNLTGKELMPERIAKAYNGFLSEQAKSKGEKVKSNILKQDRLTPEEKVAEKAERIDNTYTFSNFSETDVENMIDADVFVPEALLDKYGKNEKVQQEYADRSTMEVFLTDNEVRKALVDNPSIVDFLNAMKKYYGTAYNDNTEATLRKIFYYNKVQTPSQMRASFKSEYGNGDINKLLELKALLGIRRITKKMNGKLYTQYVVPETGIAWEKIKDLNKTSTASDIKKVTDSINDNPSMWLRAYFKATTLDYTKHFADTEVGSRDYLNAKAHLMYLSLGETQFNLVSEIRKAARLDVLSPSERADLNNYNSQIKETKENIGSALTEEYAELFREELRDLQKKRKELTSKERDGKREEKRIRDALKEAGSEYDGPTPDTLMAEVYEDVLGKNTATYKEIIEATKNGAAEKLERKLANMQHAYEEKLESRTWKNAEHVNKLEQEIARLKTTILFLKLIDDANKADAIETLKIKGMLREDNIRSHYQNKIDNLSTLLKETKEKWNQKLKEQKIDEANKLREQYLDYKLRLESMKNTFAEYKARTSINNAIKRRLNIDHNVYSASIDESAKWLYSLMHDKQGMSGIEYDTYAMKTGQTTDADVLMFFENSDDAEDADGNAVSKQYEFDPKAYNFDRKSIPDALLAYGLSDTTLAEIQSNKKYSQLSIGTLMELADAYNAAKAKAKAQKTAMDNEKATRRAKLGSEIYSSLLGTGEGGVPQGAKETILKNLGYTESDYDSDPSIQAKVLKEFTDHISRYSDILQTEVGRGTKFKGWVANAIGHIQWVADYIEQDKNGPLHDLFVTQSQKALNEYSTNRDARTKKALNDMKEAVGGERWADIYKTLCNGGTVNVKYNMADTEGGYSHRDGTISYNEALGIYIYAKNAQSFGNLINGKGNNFSLETVAGINPEAMKAYLEKEIEARNQYQLDLADYNSLPADLQRQTRRPEFKSLFFKSNTELEIRDTYAKLLNGKIEMELPSWFRPLGDAIVKTLNGDNNEHTQRMEKFAGEVLNEPFKEQANYFPKVSDESRPMNAIGEVLGKQTKYVSTNAVKERQSAFDYALRLDPINTLFGAIEAQERMLNMYQIVTDMNYVMNDNGYNAGQIIEAQFGDQMRKYLNSQISSLAGNKMILSDYEKLASKLLQNISVSKIGFNIMTSAKQFISVIPAVTNTEISASDFLIGVAKVTGNEKESIVALYEKYASDVARGSIGYEYNLLRQNAEIKGSDSFKAKLVEKSMQMTESADQLVKKWLFAAAFEKYTKAGASESEAGLKAAELIKKTQSIGDAYSLSNFERSQNPFARSFALFAKDQFQVWNSIVFGIGNDFRDKNYGAVAEKCLGIGMMTIATALLAGGWIPEEGEGMFDLDAFLEDFFTTLIGYTPVFGTFFTDDGSDSLLTEPFTKVKDVVSGTGTLGKNIVTGDYESSDWNPIINSAIDALGALSLPSVSIKRGIKTFAPNGILGEEKEFNPGWLFGSFGASTYELLF